MKTATEREIVQIELWNYVIFMESIFKLKQFSAKQCPQISQSLN